jgi:hypothetical protein
MNYYEFCANGKKTQGLNPSNLRLIQFRYLISVLSIVPQKIRQRLSLFDSDFKMSARSRLYRRDN